MNLRPLLLSLAVSTMLPALVPADASAAGRAFNVRDLSTLERVSSPVLSPNGGKVLFAVRKVDFDANVATYKDMADLFFDMHDPTTVTKEDMMKHGKFMPKGTPYQGNDYGTQYRSVIFYQTDAQKKDWMEDLAAGKRGLTHGFGICGVRVAGQRKILCRGTEFHRHADLVDQIASAGADDMRA